jgi:hypothetical protein
MVTTFSHCVVDGSNSQNFTPTSMSANPALIAPINKLELRLTFARNRNVMLTQVVITSSHIVIEKMVFGVHPHFGKALWYYLP